MDQASFDHSAEFGVVPELVYETMTDLDLVSRWLPEPFTLSEDGPSVVRVRLADRQEFLPVAGSERWYAEVSIAPRALGSRVDVTVFPRVCDEADFKQLVATAEETLRSFIEDRFTPG